VGVELGEELLDRQQPQGQHERLIAIVARANVTLAKGPGHRDLRDFLAGAEDSELRLSRKDFLTPFQTGLPAPKRDPVVLNDTLAGDVQSVFQAFFRLRQDSSARDDAS
jgi:hypothetical protein